MEIDFDAIIDEIDNLSVEYNGILGNITLDMEISKQLSNKFGENYLLQAGEFELGTLLFYQTAQALFTKTNGSRHVFEQLAGKMAMKWFSKFDAAIIENHYLPKILNSRINELDMYYSIMIENIKAKGIMLYGLDSPLINYTSYLEKFKYYYYWEISPFGISIPQSYVSSPETMYHTFLELFYEVAMKLLSFLDKELI
jgi:hypothetical protein